MRECGTIWNEIKVGQMERPVFQKLALDLTLSLLPLLFILLFGN